MIPKKLYLLQSKDGSKWINEASGGSLNGLYLRRASAEKAAKPLLGQGKTCRIIDLGINQTKTEILDTDVAIERKHQRYLKSEERFIRKLNYQVQLKNIQINFVKISDLQHNDKFNDLINEAAKNHVKYAAVLQLGQPYENLTGGETENNYLFALTDNDKSYLRDRISNYWDDDSPEFLDMIRKIDKTKFAYHVLIMSSPIFLTRKEIDNYLQNIFIQK